MSRRKLTNRSMEARIRHIVEWHGFSFRKAAIMVKRDYLKGISSDLFDDECHETLSTKQPEYKQLTLDIWQGNNNGN